MNPIALALMIAVLALLASVQGHAAEKTLVRVDFALDDPYYTDEFSDAELDSLRLRGAETIAAVLSDRFRFLDFQSAAEAAHTLTVKLDRAEGGGASHTEFGFHFQLAGPGVPQGKASYLVFRTKDQYLAPIGTIDALIVEIHERMTQVARDKLIDDLLHYVSIAEVGEFRGGEPPIWLIDRDRERLCMSRRSHLEVHALIPSSGIGEAIRWVVEPFAARVLDVVTSDDATAPSHTARTKIIATPAETVGAEKIRRLKNAPPAEVRIDSVFVLVYEPICAPGQISADTLDFRDAGAPP